MLKDVTFGQYIAAESPIHRLDPRFKLGFFTALIVFVFLASSIWSMAFLGIMLILMIAMSRISPVTYLKNIRSVIYIILFTSVINALYVSTGTVLLHFWVITVTTDGLLRALFMSLRLTYLITISALLTYTSTPTALTDALERVFSPLKFIGLGNAINSMSMMITIALRFIPTLIEETNKIMSAQKARGADMESGGLIRRIRSIIPILIPLLISAVRRAYELAEAMECRCYNGGVGRVRMKKLRAGGADFIAVAVIALIGAGVIVVNTFLKI